jgi:eukaryotic-like serine/threonine-protein kinase
MVELASPGVPTSMGRYEIVATLASGGMAEILLARLDGAEGFQRPVVVKRILPQLARTRSYRDMFVDEARIVAGIRHPNVVQVHELGQQDDELFLVMEYLDGESLGSLMRRLWSRGRRMDRDVAAWVVAEACAGLHAAHELTDEDGLPRNLVHRDVSPHNVFLGYQGGVKVLDFGIAQASERITKTETGQVKGKFEYMSPEQIQSRPLDRRADVFALGVLLYELTTARRLFKRPSLPRVIDAI